MPRLAGFGRASACSNSACLSPNRPVYSSSSSSRQKSSYDSRSSTWGWAGQEEVISGPSRPWPGRTEVPGRPALGGRGVARALAGRGTRGLHPAVGPARTLRAAGTLGVRRGAAPQGLVPRLIVQRLVAARLVRCRVLVAQLAVGHTLKARIDP